VGFSRKRKGRDGRPRYTARDHDLRGRRVSAGRFSRKADAESARQMGGGEHPDGFAPRSRPRQHAGLIAVKREIEDLKAALVTVNTPADPVNGGSSRMSRSIGRRGERPALKFSRTKYPVQWRMATPRSRAGSAGSWEG